MTKADIDLEELDAVTQADRDAAADFVHYWSGIPEIKDDFPSSIDSIWVREGRGDDEPIVQAFARHRATAIRSLIAREKVMREALVTAMIPIEAILLSGADAAHCQSVRDALHDAVSTARASLSTAKQETSDAD